MMHFIRRLSWKLFLIREVTNLGADAKARRTLRWRGLWLLLNDKRKVRSGFWVVLRHKGENFDFWFEDFGDFGTLWEIFVQGEYRIEGLQEPQVIVDLGSNIGASLLYFRQNYPSAKLYGIEADPNNFQRLQRLILNLPDIEIHHVAVWSTSGVLTLFVDPHRSSASSVSRRQDRQLEVTVTAKPLDALLDELKLDRVDLLKFDIEGAEWEVFRQCKTIDRIDTLIGEVHTDLADGTLDELIALMGEHEVFHEEIGPGRYRLIARRRDR